MKARRRVFYLDKSLSWMSPVGSVFWLLGDGSSSPASPSAGAVSSATASAGVGASCSSGAPSQAAGRTRGRTDSSRVISHSQQSLQREHFSQRWLLQVS